MAGNEKIERDAVRGGQCEKRCLYLIGDLVKQDRRSSLPSSKIFFSPPRHVCRVLGVGLYLPLNEDMTAFVIFKSDDGQVALARSLFL